MKDKNILNIQKESDRLKIKKSIRDNEDKKAKILLDMGMKVYSKIRKGDLIDMDLADMCEEIKHIDIDIYTEYMKLRSLDNDNKKIICECGYTAYKNEKFCPQCGKNLVPKEKEYIICNNCETKNDVDSNYCGCCGYKIKPQFTQDDYSNKSQLDEQYTEEEKAIELEGREFLKNQEINNYDEI